MENKRTWIYCRVAYPDSYALAVQQTRLEAYAEKQGFEIVGTTAEQASGRDFSRRGLNEVSAAVTAGEVDLLLVESLSRLGRNLEKVDAYLCWLEDRFVDVVCADGTIPQTTTERVLDLLKRSGVHLNTTR